jgi:methionine aminopeptidase
MDWERNIVIKNSAELAQMREVGRVNALALESVRALIRPGIKTIIMESRYSKVILGLILIQPHFVSVLMKSLFTVYPARES